MTRRERIVEYLAMLAIAATLYWLVLGSGQRFALAVLMVVGGLK
ncbi:MAG TPA: hypothetical protein VNL71_20195 [Chloroflexota bacterium]|nr:hypothetical protein [Chloroflexota bacterium]